MPPGAIALTRIPCGPRSIAKDFVSITEPPPGTRRDGEAPVQSSRSIDAGASPGRRLSAIVTSLTRVRAPCYAPAMPVHLCSPWHQQRRYAAASRLPARCKIGEMAMSFSRTLHELAGSVSSELLAREEQNRIAAAKVIARHAPHVLRRLAEIAAVFDAPGLRSGQG